MTLKEIPSYFSSPIGPRLWDIDHRDLLETRLLSASRITEPGTAIRAALKKPKIKLPKVTPKVKIAGPSENPVCLKVAVIPSPRPRSFFEVPRATRVIPPIFVRARVVLINNISGKRIKG